MVGGGGGGLAAQKEGGIIKPTFEASTSEENTRFGKSRSGPVVTVVLQDGAAGGQGAG